MSEFDTSGFSAIDQFFGGEDDTSASKKESAKTTSLSQPKGKRRGVGSSAPVPSKLSQTDLTKSLLRVGRKRGRIDDDEDDDGFEANENIDHEDEDDEGGRTGIAEKSKPKVDSLLADASGTSKKKLGKKERKLQEVAKKTNAIAENKLVDQVKTDQSTEKVVVGELSDSVQVDTSKKHKRRKIRSKQKNIRKDNREKKPDHLIVGRKQYRGRPLTAETREKLDLPPPKPRTHIAVNTTEQKEPVVDQGGLAIDDFLGEDTGKEVETTNNKILKQKKLVKKNKKTKYKNLK